MCLCYADNFRLESTHMNILRTGVILNTENYEECVSFYEKVFDLEILYREKSNTFQLTCFAFGGSYLMIETGGLARPAGKPVSENAAKLRVNVSDIEEALEKLRSHGIHAEIRFNAWGSTIDIHDPDGNRIGIRDDPTFLAQFET